jgi:hypothetical protein
LVKLVNAIRLVLPLVLVGGMVSCMVSCTVPPLDPLLDFEGFLSDYSKLEPSQETEGLRTYRNPRADLRIYDRAFLEPIRILTRNGDPEGVPAPELQALLDAFHREYHDGVERHFEVVHRPGPNTVRIRIAITEGEGSRVPLRLVSTSSRSQTPSKIEDPSGATYAFMDRACAEGEIADSETGEILLAAVDCGSRENSSGGHGSWKDVEETLKKWVGHFEASHRRTP